MTLINHLEKYLGKIDMVWADAEEPKNIRVVSFWDFPFKDIVTYSTLGLSKIALPMPDGRYVRQELVFSAYRNFSSEQIASFLSTFAEYLVSAHKALLQGDFIGPEAPIIRGTLLNSVYSTVPMIFDEGLAVYYGSEPPPTVFVWIIPIHEEEANYIRGNGWDKFEDVLERKNPELWDLTRVSVI
jgi:hypothetical protein